MSPADSQTPGWERVLYCTRNCSVRSRLGEKTKYVCENVQEGGAKSPCSPAEPEPPSGARPEGQRQDTRSTCCNSCRCGEELAPS